MNIKTFDSYNLNQEAKGKATFFSFSEESGVVNKLIHKNNLILYSGADILAKLLSNAQGYGVTTMYMEFKNLGSPSDPITPPVFDRTGGIDYYNGLSGSTDTD